MTKRKAFVKRSYLVRILAYTMMLILICVVVISSVLISQSEKQIVKNQIAANQKMISLIDNNITYMEELVYNLGMGTYMDNDLHSLLFTSDVVISDIYQKIFKMHTIVATNSFIDSIIIYNSTTKTYITDKAVIKDTSNADIAAINDLLMHRTDLVKQKLIPVMDDSGHVSSFVSLLYESSSTYKNGESAVLLSVKPEWFFSSIKSINDSVEQQNSRVLILNNKNQIILGESLTGLNIPDVIASIEAEDGAMHGKWISGVYGSGADKEIVDISNLNANSWRIMIAQPYNDVFGSLLEMRTTLIVIIAIFLLVALLFTYLVSIQLYKPVDNMLKVISGASHENPADRKEKDEFGYVSDLYSNVVSKLGDAIRSQQDKTSIIQNYYIRQIIMDSSSISNIEFKKIAQANKLNVYDLPLLVCIFKIDNLNRLQGSMFPSGIGAVKSEITELAVKTVSAAYPCDAVDQYEDHFVLFIGMGRMGEMKHEELKALIGQVKDAAMDTCNVSLSAAVSYVVNDSTEITKQYKLCTQTILYKLLYGRGSIIFPEMVKENLSNLHWALSEETQRKITEYIKAAQYESLKKAFASILDEVTHYHYNCILQAVSQLSIIIQNTLREMNTLSLMPVFDDNRALIQNIDSLETIEEMRDYLFSLCDRLSSRQKSRAGEREDALADTIRRLIEVNHADPNFSQAQIAELLKMSPAYLGRVFKRNNAVGIGDYINETRIQHAEMLLVNSDYSVKEIMKKSGYLSESSFWKLFKNKYGVTPKEYRTAKSMTK